MLILQVCVLVGMFLSIGMDLVYIIYFCLYMMLGMCVLVLCSVCCELVYLFLLLVDVCVDAFQLKFYICIN